MDFLTNLAFGFGVAFTPWNLVCAFIGALLGTAIGVLPGLGPGATIALLLPVTYKMDPASAIILLSGVFSGALYGGSTTSILLNIPGEASSVVTCLDGYKMARQGRAGPALGISAMGSFFAGTMSLVAISIVAPPLAGFALKFGPAEYTTVIFFGMTMAVYLSGTSILKGLILMGVGIFLGSVGIDPIFGNDRFSFGVNHLRDGVDFVVVAMGLFGITEVLSNLASPEGGSVYKTSLKGLLPNREDWRRCWASVLRGSGLGFLIGVLPGGGATIASFIAYGVEKKVSKHPERFGEGAIEGVASPESANNAAATGSLIPLLTLGVPGNNTMAMLFVALMLHGITPGPMLVQEHPDVFWGVIASLYIGNVMLLALNLPLIGLWVRFLEIPYHYLAVIVTLCCVIGSYSIKSTAFDVGMMVAFGVFGYFMRKGGFPVAPLVLAIVLGRTLESNFVQSLQLSGGDLRIFIEKPIAASFLAITAVVVVFMPLSKWLLRKYKKRELDDYLEKA
jgi:putative tricarboxylic transport membrane protein